MADVGKLKLSLDPSSIGSVVLDGVDLGKYSSCIEYKAKAGEIAELTITLSLVDVDAEIEFLPEKLRVAVNQLRDGEKYCTALGHIKTVGSA